MTSNVVISPRLPAILERAAQKESKLSIFAQHRLKIYVSYYHQHPRAESVRTISDRLAAIGHSISTDSNEATDNEIVDVIHDCDLAILFFEDLYLASARKRLEAETCLTAIAKPILAISFSGRSPKGWLRFLLDDKEWLDFPRDDGLDRLFDEITTLINKRFVENAGPGGFADVKAKETMQGILRTLYSKTGDHTDPELLRCFYACLFFNEDQHFTVDDIKLFWRCDVGECYRILGELEQNALISRQKIGDEDLFQVQKAAWEPIKSLSSYQISCLRYQIILGFGFQRELVGDDYLPFHATQQLKRNILEQTVEKLHPKHLVQLALLRSKISGQLFVDFLYKFSDWPFSSGNVKYPKEHANEFEGCNISYRLLRKLLLKVNAEGSWNNMAEIAEAKTKEDDETDDMAETFADVVYDDENDENDKYDREPLCQLMGKAHFPYVYRKKRKYLLMKSALPNPIRLVLLSRGDGRSNRDELVKIETQTQAETNAMLEAIRWTAIMGRFYLLKTLTDKWPASIQKHYLEGRTLLSLASENGHLEMVRYLLDKAHRLASKGDNMKRTPLFYASRMGHADVVSFLIEKAPEAVSIVTSDCCSPFTVACQYGHLEIAKLLAEKDPKMVTKETSYQQTPMLLACKFGQLDIASFIATIAPHSASVPDGNDGTTPLLFASHHGHYAVVKFLVEIAPETVAVTEEDGTTPLWAACQEGHLEIVKMLAELAPETITSATKRRGCTTLLIASQRGHLDVVRFLAEKAPSLVTKADNDGCTPLWIASQNGHLEIIRYLAELAPQTLYKSTDEGKTPLSQAASFGHLEVVKYLAEKAPNTVTEKCNNGVTPLSVAVKGGAVDVIRFLSEKAPETLTSPSNDGETPLFVAAKCGRLEVLKIVAEMAPSTLNIARNDGATPLFAASRVPCLEIVKFLAEKAPDTVAKPKNLSLTPLWIASENGYLDIVTFLAEKAPQTVAAPRTDGATPLWAASNAGHLDVVKFLAEKAPETKNKPTLDGKSPIYCATLSDETDVVTFLYDANKDYVFKTPMTFRSPFIIAAENENRVILELFLSDSVDKDVLVNQLNSMKENGLYEALCFLFITFYDKMPVSELQHYFVEPCQQFCSYLQSDSRDLFASQIRTDQEQLIKSARGSLEAIINITDQAENNSRRIHDVFETGIVQVFADILAALTVKPIGDEETDDNFIMNIFLFFGNMVERGDDAIRKSIVETPGLLEMLDKNYLKPATYQRRNEVAYIIAMLVAHSALPEKELSEFDVKLSAVVDELRADDKQIKFADTLSSVDVFATILEQTSPSQSNRPGCRRFALWELLYAYTNSWRTSWFTKMILTAKIDALLEKEFGKSASERQGSKFDRVAAEMALELLEEIEKGKLEMEDEQVEEEVDYDAV